MNFYCLGPGIIEYFPSNFLNLKLGKKWNGDPKTTEILANIIYNILTLQVYLLLHREIFSLGVYFFPDASGLFCKDISSEENKAYMCFKEHVEIRSK